MEPTLRNGDWWLVRRGSHVSAGDMALLRHPVRRDMLVVKRVIRPEADGWWVEGDNPDFSDDSRTFGVVAPQDVVGRLWWRYRPLILKG
jgi:nickel-type superoxide dismutase maturation protease